ncbi:MAG TPA: B-box zinc finger protein, partial [Acidobacteriaceae bacterium]|nr:B-box zinc finger protein [Acidobacteriaceae bacterium]
MNCANHPDRERVAFCQNCGKPLCEECKRTIGSSVFCEPCFAGRSAGTPPPPGGFPGYTAPPAGYAPGVPRRHPEPVVAALLGFIPGVGAMYNEQYAKGIVHLIVFAILVSLANTSDVFGWFVAGWEFYMAFEAYHTARARRDGTQLPNPFGLNDLGERMGFGRAWPGAHTPYGGSSVPPYDPAAGQTPPQGGPGAQTWTAPGGTYFHQGSDGSQTYSAPGAHYHRGADGTQTYGAPPASQWGAPADVPPVPPVPPMPGFSDASAPHHRTIPTGALWLIGLGVLFLIGHEPVFRAFHGRFFGPLLMIGIGVWMFVRRMTESGHSLENDGTDHYRWRLAHALNGAAWVILFGVIWMLDSLGVLTWSHSWPIYMIGAGVLMIFRRTLFSPGYAPMPPYGSAPVTPPAGTASAATTTAIVPADPALSGFTRSD